MSFRSMFRRLIDPLMLPPPVSGPKFPAPNEADEIDEYRRFDIPANYGVLRRIPGNPTYPYSKHIRRIEGRYAICRPIAGHPDLNHYLWFEAGKNVPLDCRWVVCGTASFADPDTNIIFARATGTHDFSVRVPRSVLPQFAELKWEVDHSMAESVWIHSRLRVDEDQRLLAIARLNAAAVQIAK